MAKVTIGPAWQVFTDGTVNGILSAPGTILLYIGASAPTQADNGIPFTNEKIQVGSPAKSWIRSHDLNPVDGVMFTF